MREEQFHLKNAMACRHGIRMCNVEMYYDIAEIGVHSRPALTALNLYIPAGAKVGIIGKSRAGKSTLLGLLARLRQPTSGFILWDGVPLNDIDLYDALTLVLQDTLLFNDTILANLLLGVKEPPSDAVLKKVLQACAMWDDIQNRPLKLQTSAGNNGQQFSGGFRQRLSIARGMLCNRSVFLLDEPTSAQDNECTPVLSSTLGGLTGVRMPATFLHHVLFLGAGPL